MGAKRISEDERAFLKHVANKWGAGYARKYRAQLRTAYAMPLDALYTVASAHQTGTYRNLWSSQYLFDAIVYKRHEADHVEWAKRALA